MPGLNAIPTLPADVADPFQCYLAFERKRKLLMQLTVVVHELRSESAALFQSIKLMKLLSRNLTSSGNLEKEEVTKLITHYEAEKKTCDKDFFYEEGRNEANQDYRKKIDKLIFGNETWQQRLEAIKEEIARMNDKIQKQNRRILKLKLKSLDVGNEIRLLLSSFSHYDQIKACFKYRP